jgi:hypothetical protein
MTDIDAYEGNRITVDEPAYDGWYVDLWIFDTGGRAAGFLAFCCVDDDDQIAVITQITQDGFGPPVNATPSETEATQVIEMFRREPYLRVIKGTVTLRDGAVSFEKAGAQPNIITLDLHDDDDETH